MKDCEIKRVPTRNNGILDLKDSKDYRAVISFFETLYQTGFRFVFAIEKIKISGYLELN